MHALVLEDFHAMAVTELPDPVAGEGEVLLSVISTGICGSEAAIPRASRLGQRCSVLSCSSMLNTRHGVNTLQALLRPRSRAR